MPRLPKANVRWSSQLCRAMSIASPIMHVKKVRIILGSRLREMLRDRWEIYSSPRSSGARA